MKKCAILLGITLVCGRAGAQVIADPDNGHYYEVIASESIPWINAEEDALSLHYDGLEGHLATITSADEDMFVGDAVTAYVAKTGGSGEYWLGGYQNPITETSPQVGWTWVNSEGTFPGFNGATSGYDNLYANWNGGEPNDAYGPGSEQYLGINLGNPGGFNDEGNLGLIGGYVVEFDPNTISSGGLVPDTATTATLLMGSITALGALSRRLRR